MTDLHDAARFLAHYSKRYCAGAFATPSAAELAKRGRVLDWRGSEGERTVAVVAELTRPTRRRDFTGSGFTVGPGPVITHLARTERGPVPDLDAFAQVFAYAEDRDLARRLEGQGRERQATAISTASEIITCWGRRGSARPYSRADAATVVATTLELPERLRAPVLSAIEAEVGWSDDFPYYSDGTWGSVNLAGYQPDDETWGIKPSEMPRSWQAEHPEALDYRVGWTAAAERHRVLSEWVQGVGWWHQTERVRLLRMAGRDGRGGKLGRHCDIGDRAAGTRDGQVVRFHVPLVSHPAVKMHVWELDGIARDVHLQPWRCYYLDARKPHAVTNPTAIDRVHLVVDVIADEAVRLHLGY